MFDYSEIDHPTYIKEVSNTHQTDQIIIDYGTSTTKAGYLESQSPDLVFRSFVNKIKDPKTMQTVAAIGGHRGNYQSPYEMNLLHHSGLLESINDYIFMSLKSDKVPSLCVTECVANTEYSRSNLLEQLFECYETPSLLLGIDSLFSAYYHQKSFSNYLNRSALVISMGDYATHIIPIIDGCIKYENIKRVNVGGQQSFNIFQKTLHLRHPHLKSELNYYFLEKLHHSQTQVAMNYHEQLKYFSKEKDSNIYRDKITEENKMYPNHECIDEIKVVFGQLQNQQYQNLNEDEQKRKMEVRARQGERLREALAKKKQEKQVTLKQQLDEYEEILKAENSKQQAETMFPGKGIEELKKRIKMLKVKTGILPKEALDEDKYQYVNVPDSQLTPEQLNQKRYQVMMKQAQISKAQKKVEEQKKKDEAKQFRDQQPEHYLQLLYDKRTQYIRKIQERKKKIQEMNQRNSRFNQRRMQTLAFLGQGDDDNFGINDEDWDLYRGISKELDSDEENMEIKLQEIDLELKELDQNYEQKILEQIANKHYLGMDLCAMNLSVDRVKCNEVYFQPSICGVDQCGIIEAIMLSIKSFSQQDMGKLVSNVLLTGGASLTKGMKERIKKDLQMDCPTDMNVNVESVDDPLFDSWRGMQYQSIFRIFAKTILNLLDNSVFQSKNTSNMDQ